MDTLVDDVGSFPLPAGIKREEYARAYEAARQAIINHQDPSKEEFIQKNFYSIVVESFKAKIRTGLDVVNFPSTSVESGRSAMQFMQLWRGALLSLTKSWRFFEIYV
jgi:hypothetical protein